MIIITKIITIVVQIIMEIEIRKTTKIGEILIKEIIKMTLINKEMGAQI